MSSSLHQLYGAFSLPVKSFLHEKQGKMSHFLHIVSPSHVAPVFRPVDVPSQRSRPSAMSR